ncbi:PAS domain-containing protein [soil metagenome]
MFHSGTQILIDHWAALPDARRIPARADLEPMALGALAPQLFMVERTGARLRLAGGWVERLHGRPLRGVDWLELWSEHSRAMVTAAMVQAFREARPVVLAAEAFALDGVIEIVVAPLRNAQGLADRMVGLYQPTCITDREAKDIGLMTARLSVGAGALSRPPLNLAAVDGRRIA